MEIKQRLQILRKQFAEKEIDALLISQPENLYYLTGCEGLEGYLLITEQAATIVTDFRYVEQAQRRSPEYTIFRIVGKMADWLPKLFEDSQIKRLGFESSHITVSTFDQFTEILDKIEIKLIAVNGLIERLRAVKDPQEIERIEKAVKITDAALAHAAKLLRAGMTEKELAWEIEEFMRENGSQSVPFELIVASGPNAALPHAHASDRVIKMNEPVIADIGSKFDFYASDLTRTFYLGQPDETFLKVYNTVLEAQQTAIAQIRVGMTGAEVDAIARNIIAKAGYDELFGHSLGHGFGLVVHEKPSVGPNSTDVLDNGMVFTVEPGIYIRGWGGVRIEDDVVIEKDRARVISGAKK